MLNKTFFHFFFAFLVIITGAFGVLMWAGSQVEVEPVDNLAQPQ